MKSITRYFGFASIASIWIVFFGCLAIHPPNLSEPISQLAYYASTRLIAIGIFTIFSILYYFFARHLDNYWEHTSKFAIVGGIFFFLTAVIRYKPYAHSFVLDLHNLSITFAAICYSLPMLFIGYKKTHVQMAKLSRILFFITLTLTVVSFIVRALDLGIFYAQLIAFTPFSLWVIITNALLLEHQKQTSETKL